MIFLRTYFSLAFALCLTIRLAAQAGNTENIRQLFFEELKKAGVEQSYASANNIQFIKVNRDNEKKFSLNGKAAESFFVKATENSLLIASTSHEGLQNGMYWYLYFLGFRYYFPNEYWHHIPKLISIFQPVEKLISPSFDHRRIWYAYGTGSKQADKDYQKWVSANLLGGVEVNVGHSYDGIVNRNRVEFQKHPEYFAQKVSKGQIPKNPKFEVSNEGLVNLVIRDAFDQIELKIKKTGNPPGMISMDPSDGGGFSTSAAAKKIGSISNQVFYLANRVAKAIRERYPTVQIGLYAYYQHAAPPDFELEPNIVVLIATAMNQSALRTDELITAWKEKGVKIGIRDYYGVMAWDWDMPGKPLGSKLAYVMQLQKYHKEGVRFFSAETNVGWISRGLAHYIASQLLWDINKNPISLREEFFIHMFGKAAGEIKKLYNVWDNYLPAIPPDGDLNDWYQIVGRAAKMEDNRMILSRITQIKMYLNYVGYFKKWRETSNEKNLIALLSYAYRLQDEGIVASYPLFRRIADHTVAGKKNMRFNDPDALWKRNDQKISDREVDDIATFIVKSLQKSERTISDIFPETFAGKTALKSNGGSDKLETSMPARLRGSHKVVFKLTGDATINLATGLIKAREYKTLRLLIYPYTNNLNTNGESLLEEIVQPGNPLRSVSLKSLQPGTYIAVIDDARNGFTLSFSGAVLYGIVAGNENRMWGFGRNNLYFSIDNTKAFQIRNDGVLTLVSPAGRIIDLQKKKGLIEIQVQKGELGIWKMQGQNGTFNLQGIVPLINTDLHFLLK